MAQRSSSGPRRLCLLWLQLCIAWSLIAAAQQPPLRSLQLNRTKYHVVAVHSQDNFYSRYSGILQDYLNRAVGSKFDPPVSFKLRVEVPKINDFGMHAFTESEASTIDFTFTEAKLASCLEAEYQHSPLVTQRVYVMAHGQRQEVNQMGGVVIVKKSNTNITSLSDLRDRVVSAQKLPFLYQHSWVLHEAGISALTDCRQIRLESERTHQQLIGDVLDGEVDAAFIVPDALEEIDAAKRDELRVLNSTNGAQLGKKRFPFDTTSDLYPQAALMAAPHVEWELQREVVIALLSLNSTSPEVLQAKIAGFQPSLSYSGARNLLEMVGLLGIDVPSRSASCEHAADTYGQIRCPVGSYVLPRKQVASACAVTNQPCPHGECLCRPCLRAPDDVQVVVVATHDHWDETENPELYEDKNLDTQLETCRKMQMCGILHQREELQFIIDDHLLRPAMDVRWKLRKAQAVSREVVDDFVGAGSGYAILDPNGVFTHTYGLNITTASIGVNILEVYLDEVQLPVSPFLVQCDQVPCERANHIANATGYCNCNTGNGYVRVYSACMHVSLLVGVIVVPIVVFLFIIIIVYLRGKVQQADAVWKIDFSDLLFADPPEVLGRGTFGLVVGAEYRTTNVAIKHVLPASGTNSKKNNMLDSVELAVGSVAEFNSDSMTMAGVGQLSQHSGSEFHVLPMFSASFKRANTGSQSGSFKGLQAGSSFKGPISVSHSSRSDSAYSHAQPGENLGIKTMASISSKVSILQRILPCFFSEGRAQRVSFIKEMRMLSRLRHPCITTVMGAVIDCPYGPMLVMERMEHGSLHDLAHNHTMAFDGEIVVPMVRHVAQGLSFLHSCKPPIVHGDLKAANVLVDSQFRAKIADFGLTTKSISGKKKRAHGTMYWMAPELLNGAPNSIESDMYAFGLTLWEVYARADPYEGLDVKAVVAGVKDTACAQEMRPVLPPKIPSEIAVLMKSCWHQDPSCRPEANEVGRTLKTLDVSAMGVQGAKKSHENAHAVLHDIFPKHVADKLLAGHKVDPEHRDQVTIFFSDIVKFTEIAQKLQPQKVSDMLDRLYTVFDRLSREHEVFKVETIGDAYMAVTNLVENQHDDHALRIAEFALDAIAGAAATPIDVDDLSLGNITIRVGFHCGPVVASVVGTRNPRYCLFGDTVNTSSRMESNSVPGEVHCSEAAAKILVQQIHKAKQVRAVDLTLVSRGVMKIKGKGPMATFFVKLSTCVGDGSAIGKVRKHSSARVSLADIHEHSEREGTPRSTHCAISRVSSSSFAATRRASFIGGEEPHTTTSRDNARAASGLCAHAAVIPKHEGSVGMSNGSLRQDVSEICSEDVQVQGFVSPDTEKLGERAAGKTKPDGPEQATL